MNLFIVIVLNCSKPDNAPFCIPVKTITNLSNEDSMMYFIDTHSTYRDGSQYGDKSYLFWNEKEFEILY